MIRIGSQLTPLIIRVLRRPGNASSSCTSWSLLGRRWFVNQSAVTISKEDEQTLLRHYGHSNADDFFSRTPKPDDIEQVKRCCAGTIDTLDYVPAYFQRYLEQPKRRCIVVTERKTGRIGFFMSMLMNDDGRSAVSGSGRMLPALRGKRLNSAGFQFLLSHIGSEFPNCSEVTTVTRIDYPILIPRFIGKYQKNKILGAKLLMNLSCNLADLAKLTRSMQQTSETVHSIPFADSSLLHQSPHIRKQLLSDEFVLVDSWPYRLAYASNFASNPFGTKVFISGKDSAASNSTSKANAVSFVNVNPVETGLHFKFYIYATTIDTALMHLRHSLTDSLDELHRLRQTKDLAQYTKNPDCVNLSIVFPLALNARDLRRRLYDLGFHPGVTGTDIQRLYLCLDEGLTALMKIHIGRKQ